VEVGRDRTAVHSHLNAENKTPLPSWKSSIISRGGNVAAVFTESDSARIFYLQHIEHYGAAYSSQKFPRPMWFHLQVVSGQRLVKSSQCLPSIPQGGDGAAAVAESDCVGLCYLQSIEHYGTAYD
jgi:hypothetical protein